MADEKSSVRQLRCTELSAYTVTVDGDLWDDPTNKDKHRILLLEQDCFPCSKIDIIHALLRVQIVTENVIGALIADFSVFGIQCLDSEFGAGKEQFDDLGIFQHGVSFPLSYYSSRN